jgi:hypothetical protein
MRISGVKTIASGRYDLTIDADLVRGASKNWLWRAKLISVREHGSPREIVRRQLGHGETHYGADPDEAIAAVLAKLEAALSVATTIEDSAKHPQTGAHADG